MKAREYLANSKVIYRVHHADCPRIKQVGRRVAFSIKPFSLEFKLFIDETEKGVKDCAEMATI